MSCSAAFLLADCAGAVAREEAAAGAVAIGMGCR